MHIHGSQFFRLMSIRENPYFLQFSYEITDSRYLFSLANKKYGFLPMDSGRISGY